MLHSFMRNSADIPQLNVVAQFQSAEEAISYAQENTFELALLDVCLPGMNGIELAVELRKYIPGCWLSLFPHTMTISAVSTKSAVTTIS